MIIEQHKQQRAAQSLEDHYLTALRYATDDELRVRQSECQFVLDMAVDAEIEHSTDFLDTTAAELTAATMILSERQRRGFEVIDSDRREFDRHLLDEIRGRLDLAVEIGRTVTLVKAGRNFRGLCPFHEERSPSFTVYGDDGHYFCFGCQTHGDIFDWFQFTDGLTFPQAVRLAAGRAGVALPSASRDEPFKTDAHGRWVGVVGHV